jgi:hypothetical protein
MRDLNGETTITVPFFNFFIFSNIKGVISNTRDFPLPVGAQKKTVSSKYDICLNVFYLYIINF